MATVADDGFANVTVHDVSWQTVHSLLLKAALAPPGILVDLQPFVFQYKLNDTAISDEINAYTKKSEQMARVYSSLYQNIIDVFNC